MFTTVRDETRCVGCGECVVVCPQSGPESRAPVLVDRGPGEVPEVAHIENCIQCMSCVDVCRASAILFQGAYEVTRLIADADLAAQVRKVL